MGIHNVKTESPVQANIQHGVKAMLDQGRIKVVYLSCSCTGVSNLLAPPDALVKGDACTEQYYENYGECDVMNPGAFWKQIWFSGLSYVLLGKLWITLLSQTLLSQTLNSVNLIRDGPVTS